MKGTKNPYVKRLKQPMLETLDIGILCPLHFTIRLDKETVAYFKALAADLGMPYQNIINLYLRDCAMSQRKLKLKWAAARVRPT